MMYSFLSTSMLTVLTRTEERPTAVRQVLLHHTDSYLSAAPRWPLPLYASLSVSLSFYRSLSLGADREVQSVRQLMVDILQNHTKVEWPDLCPPLRPYRYWDLLRPHRGTETRRVPEPDRQIQNECLVLIWWFCGSSSEELLPLLGQRSDHYTAIIVEEPDSYVGREVAHLPVSPYRLSHPSCLSLPVYLYLSVSQVILDLLQYSGVEVKRALSSERPLLDALKITRFPSVYLLHPNATHTYLHVWVHTRTRIHTLT